ncbi:Piso0_003327 [Millerozyma farinosa CBS 7064]|uniref:Structural maintenance of chromosomes protein n=1 Tax=Pichia sorbitophila (strain ATCC MYA-4447 / BCRC 22081 / CBS 7064 / NBRC 10061 / NRRL Y-12695) TaxID=559304 RepID=G8YHT8_PICSO|nr:Piso0_003327 [Millerozyma farinosa CBS 7064]CCE80990.1 Piso0_003327 [Millerozyma farinosa CBS 7064]
MNIYSRKININLPLNYFITSCKYYQSENMGRLIGLELQNFKSYRGTTKIGFGSSYFTSIIGPNGAGKSNMMDAISFVLGVKSTHLRSHTLKDLIYRGRLEGNEGFDKRESSSEPRSAYVMAIYQKESGEKIKLKRTITISGSSEYKINDKAVTALEYSTVLKNENILIKARNFLVFQGDVEQVASQSPKELTKLIETISGSGELKNQYDELKEESERAREFSNSVFSRRRTLNSESRQYKEQLIEQEEFERKLMEKNDLTKVINLYHLYHNEKKHVEYLEDLESKTHDLSALKNKLNDEQQKFQKLKSLCSEKVLNLQKHDKKKTEALSRLENKKCLLIPIDTNRKSLLMKIQTCKNRMRDISYEISKQNSEIQSTARELKEATDLFKKYTSKSSTNSVSKKCQDEYEKLRVEFLSSGGSQLEEDLSLLENQKESTKSVLTNLSIQRKNSESRIRELQDIIENELNFQHNTLNKEITDLLAVRDEYSEARSSLIRKREEYGLKEMEENRKLRDILLRVEELSSQQKESSRQKKLHENVSMLKKLFPKGAIKGLVYELIRPSQRKYEAALSTVLGRNFDAVIVETTSVAYKCIEILKERRSGVATFIPLDSIVAEHPNFNYLRSLNEKAKPGIDILEYDDSSLEQAVIYIVGGSLVVDDIESARTLKWNSKETINEKIVTLDGSVIHKSGLMTGGQQQKKSQASVGWDQNEWTKLLTVKDEIIANIAKLSDEKPKEIDISDLTDKINELQNNLPSLRSKKSNLERIIKDRQTEIDFQKEQLVALEKSLKEKNKPLSQIESNISKITSKYKSLQEKVYGDFCSKYDYEGGIEEYESTHGSTMRSRAKETIKFSKAVDTLTNKLRYENEKLEETKARETSIKDQLKELEDDLEKFNSEKEVLESKIDKLEAECEMLTIERKGLSDNLNQELEICKTNEKQIQSLNTDITNLHNTILNIEEVLYKIDSERVNVLKNCKIQNINVPLKDGLLENISIEQSAENLIKKTYELEIDYDMLSEELRSEYNTRKEAELQARLSLVLEDLDRLTPNGKAVQRLKQAETKLKEFDKDFTKARQKENAILDRFNEVKERRYSIFMEAFNHISDKIDFIYKELTKSSNSPLGGSAYLTLEDEDEPYNAGIKYHAMPPMKRFRDMELLSGGEKTVAALALLFAIHSYHPSPFFVLDEVDAALDNANVNKIASYIKKYAGPNFQFIVISLKNSLFERSDALVGIYREQRENSSKTVTLDLRDYPEENVSTNSKSLSVA